MPKTAASDAQHGVFTDHSIPRVPGKAAAPSTWRLRGFSAADAGDRELGLAYAQVAAASGDRRQQTEAIRLLTAAPQDAEVQTRLAFLMEGTGSPERAATLYQSALRQDPDQIVAMVNLGRLFGTRGFLDRAIALWRSAIERNPCLEEAGVNLQVALRAKEDLAGADAVRRAQSGCVF
jgi:lipopolysaccharide biosynthesis regulator YciM